MFVVTLLLYTVLLALTGLYFYVKMKRPEGYPPGPAQWPLLGNIVSQAFCRNFTECYCYWAKKYGKVFSFKFGQYDVVIVCDYKIAKDINTWETLTSRPQYLFYHFFMKYQNLGIIFSNGELWKQNRRFTLKTLRDYGFGKKKMEGTIYEEFNILLEDIFKEGIPMGDGKVVEFKDAMTLATENIMNSFTTGKRYEKDDEEFHKLTNILKTRIVDLSFIKLMSIFPTIYHRIPDFWLKERYNERDYFYSQMKKVIQEHRKTLDPAEPRDFIDCSLIEQDRLLNSNDSKEQVFTDDNIAWTLADLFLAGSDTTSNTLRWFFLYIIHHPQYQARIQQEIDTVLGRERKPTWDDHLQMPFTEACVLEILRKVSVVPFGVDRRAEEDVVIGGYKIPKGTIVMTLIHAIHHDPEYFENPDEFCPDRFIEDGVVNYKKPGFLPFQAGKRKCPGEILARITTFLAAIQLLQNHTFSKVSGEKYSLLPQAGGIHRKEPVEGLHIPERFKMLITPRDS